MMDKTSGCEAGFFPAAWGTFYFTAPELSPASTVNRHQTKNKDQPNP
jgi:hypothetical protein